MPGRRPRRSSTRTTPKGRATRRVPVRSPRRQGMPRPLRAGDTPARTGTCDTRPYASGPGRNRTDSVRPRRGRPGIRPRSSGPRLRRSTAAIRGSSGPACGVAGISPCRRTSSALNIPGVPEAASSWPMSLFTEPIDRAPVRGPTPARGRWRRTRRDRPPACPCRAPASTPGRRATARPRRALRAVASASLGQTPVHGGRQVGPWPGDAPADTAQPRAGRCADPAFHKALQDREDAGARLGGGSPAQYGDVPFAAAEHTEQEPGAQESGGAGELVVTRSRMDQSSE